MHHGRKLGSYLIVWSIRTLRCILLGRLLKTPFGVAQVLPIHLANMALSLSNFLLPISLLSSIARCATVTYDFDIGWTFANPDGQQTRPVIGVNGQWPPPAIVAAKGDRVIVNVKNSLGNESTSLHFHGLYQNGTTHMDGPVAVSQCGILPGSEFKYNFTVSIHRVPFAFRCEKGLRCDNLVDMRKKFVSGRVSRMPQVSEILHAYSCEYFPRKNLLNSY